MKKPHPLTGKKCIRSFQRCELEGGKIVWKPDQWEVRVLAIVSVNAMVRRTEFPSAAPFVCHVKELSLP